MDLPRAASRPSGRTTRAVGLALSAVSLGAVIWWATRQPAPELPDTAAEWSALAAALLLYAAATGLRGERWFHLLRHDGARPSRGDALGLTVVGYMGNNVLPARGGDAMRVYLMAPRAGTGYRAVVGTLLAERILDASFLLALFAILAYLVLDGIDAPDLGDLATAAAVGLSVVALAGLAAYLLRNRPRVRSILSFAAPMAAATRDLRGAHGTRMGLWTVAIWVIEAATYWCAGAAVGLDMTAIEALYIVTLASVFVLIPSGPGYLGTLDAAIVFGARAVGAGGGVALSFLLVLRFVLLVPITLAGLALMIGRYGRRSEQAAHAGTEGT